MNTSAKGLRVLVTAGAAGIGLAIARTFRDAGAKVFVCDVDDKALAALDQDIGRTKADVASV
ncbi:MAG TPA: SDR family NAD(P)-dependent oxidoreductase, partial [Burkholderiales bacterium]|nr:SDR family NAD(P)-dependent oxidoreductase [Burkholderiales bacterium]